MAKKFVDGNGLLYVWQKAVGKFVAKEAGKGLSSNDYTTEEKNKLAGIEAGANAYTHPTYVQKAEGLYKVTIDATGHVSSVSTVTKEDITSLGIPSENVKVIDSLVSTSTSEALSANQGRVLDEKIKAINDNIADLGGGDMLKSVYDTDNNGKVDDADKLGGHTPDYFAKADDIPKNVSDLTNDVAVQYTAQTLTDDQKSQARENIGAGTSNFSGDYNDLANKPTNFAPETHSHEISNVNGLSGALDGKVNTSTLGQANGVATLDGTGLIPSTQLPSYVDDVVEGYAKTTSNTTTSGEGVEITTVTVDGFYKESTYTTAITGESGKIYVDISTNISYRWGETVFVPITSSDMTALTNTEIDSILGS